MFIKSLGYLDLKNCDILSYRPHTIFGYLIGFFTSVIRGKFDRVTFSHVAAFVRDEKMNNTLRRFDAMEGEATGFRDVIGKAYVFRFKHMTKQQKLLFTSYLMSREGSRYDRRGILQFLKDLWILKWFFKNVHEDEFADYCSELIKNALVFAGMIKDCEKITPHDLYKLIRRKVDFVGIYL